MKSMTISVLLMIGFCFCKESAPNIQKLKADSGKAKRSPPLLDVNSALNIKLQPINHDTSKKDRDTNSKGENDLFVQTRMADATDKSVFWSKAATFGAIGVGTLGIILSLFQWYKSGKQEITKTRAYIEPKIENPKLIEDKGVFKIPLNISIKNIGQTPARRVKGTFDFYVEDEPTKSKFPISSPIIVDWPTLSAGESDTTHHVIEFSGTDIASIIQDIPSQKILINGAISYFDISKKRRKRKWSWQLFEYRSQGQEFIPLMQPGDTET